MEKFWENAAKGFGFGQKSAQLLRIIRRKGVVRVICGSAS